MDHDETGCQAPPEGPILYINNCGFFGSVATMNMCSKCYKDSVLKQEQAKLAASSFENIVNGSTSSVNGNEPIIVTNVDVHIKSVEPIVLSTPEPRAPSSVEGCEAKPKQGPNRCTTFKRVGLTGFNCGCGNMFAQHIDSRTNATAHSTIALLGATP